MPIAPLLRPTPPPSREALRSQPPSAPGPSALKLSHRRLLTVLGTGGATVLVAGVGVGSCRVFDTLARQPWLTRRSGCGHPGREPHNTQPWLFWVTDMSR